MEKVRESLKCFFFRERITEPVSEETGFAHGVQDEQQVCFGALGLLETDGLSAGIGASLLGVCTYCILLAVA